jgi:hypothetical protein
VLVLVKRVQHLLVDAEAAADGAGTESGYDYARNERQGERRVSVYLGEQSVGDHGGRVGEELGDRYQCDPFRFQVAERASDRIGAGYSCDREHSDRRDARGDGRRCDRPLAQSARHQLDDSGDPLPPPALGRRHFSQTASPSVGRAQSGASAGTAYHQAGGFGSA